MQDLPVGTQIKNTANIYFDYNPAVVTNTTLNTIGSFTGIHSSVISDQIKIFPNPAQNILMIDFGNNKSGTVEIIDLQGRMITNKNVMNDAKTEITISGLANGMYLLRVTVEMNVQNIRFIKN
jgi:hypothetical protein